MKLVGALALIAFLSFVGPIPLAGHEGYHHGYTNSSCWDCGHHSQYQDSHCQGPQVQRQWRGEGTSRQVTNLETVEGKITEVIYLPGATPSSGMVEIRILSANQVSLVRLAPSGYLKQGGLLLREGDAVTVKGYRVAAAEDDLLVATEIRNGTKQLTLRDANGRQAW